MRKTPSKPPHDTIAKEIDLPYRVRRTTLLPAPGHRLGVQSKLAWLHKGVSKKDLEGFKEAAGLDYDALATLLTVTRATLINKKGTEKFSVTIAERIIALVDLYATGYAVFGSAPAFHDWMKLPNKALGGQAPIGVSVNQFGREEVKNLLGRMEHGIPS